MEKLAIAKVFLGDGDNIIVYGEMEEVDKYLSDIYKSECLLDDNVEFDKEEHYDRCEYCESLRGDGKIEECPVLVTSHEENLDEEELDECLEYYREDMPCAEVIGL